MQEREREGKALRGVWGHWAAFTALWIERHAHLSARYRGIWCMRLVKSYGTSTLRRLLLA